MVVALDEGAPRFAVAAESRRREGGLVGSDGAGRRVGDTDDRRGSGGGSQEGQDVAGTVHG